MLRYIEITTTATRTYVNVPPHSKRIFKVLSFRLFPPKCKILYARQFLNIFLKHVLHKKYIGQKHN